MTGYRKILLLTVSFLCFAGAVLAQCVTSASITATNSGVICSGNSIELTATAQGTGPYSYVWNTGETTQTITINRGGNYSVIVTNGVETCTPATANTTVTEVAGPGPPVAAGQVVCHNGQATLTATGPGGGYAWYNVPTGGTPLFFGASFTTPPIQQSTVYYVETNLGGCVSPRTPVQVEISGGPQTEGAQICAGNTALLKAFNGSSYTWHATPGGPVLATGSTFTTPPLTTTTTYYVVAVVNGCTSAPTPVTANVTPYPAAPNVTPPTICTGSKADLHATANGVIDWFDVPTGGTSLITSPDYTTPKLTTTTTYWVQNSFNGCVSPRVAVTVTVNPVPDAPTVQTTGDVCVGSQATLTASASNATTFNWYADAEAKNLVFTGNPYQPVVSGTTTFYAQTLNGGCISTLTPVQVNTKPKPPLPTAAVTPVCQNTPSTLTALTPGGTYEWFDSPTAVTPVGTGETFVTPPIASNTTFYLQTTVNGCVSDRAAVTATIFTPTTPPTGFAAPICQGDVGLLIASGSDNYQWFDAPTGGAVIAAGRVFITQPLAATTTYYVQTTANGCASTRTAVTVVVNPQPQAPVISSIPSRICPGSTATITASVPAGGTIVWLDFNGTEVNRGTTWTTPTLYETTNYYLVNQAGTCSSAQTVVTVKVDPVVYPQFQYSSGTFCTTGGNVTPIYIDPAGGTFSSRPGLRFVSATTGEIDVAHSLPGTYTVRFVGNDACHAITESSISIVIVPKADFNYQGPYCQYANINPSPQFGLDATGGNFTASPAGLVFFEGTGGTIDLKKSAPGTYTITNTIPANGTCPEVSFSRTVVISPGASVNAGPDQRVGAGQTVQLHGEINGVTNGTWSGGTGTFSDVNNKDATYTPGPGENSAVLTLRTENPPGNCGSKTDQVRIIFDPKPSSPVVEPASICVGDRATLSATAPGGSYAWFTVPTGGTAVGTGPNFTTPNLTASTTYYVQTTIGANTSERTAVTVTTNNIPDVPTATVGPACFNTAATFTASGSTGVYEWYNVAVGGTRLATGATFTTQPLQNNASYFVQAMSGTCASARFKVDIVLIPAPVITSAPRTTICTSNLLSYTIISDMANATYTWERPAVAGIQNAPVASHSSNLIEETLINTTDGPIDVVYNIVATGNTCNTAFQYRVTVNPGANLVNPTPAPVCNGLPLNYDVNFNTAVTDFSWTREAVAGISNAPVAGQAAKSIREILYNTTDLPVQVTYRFDYTSGNCVSSTTMVATINPTVNITSSTAPIAACNNVPFEYTMQSNVAAATFRWRRTPNPLISNPIASGNTATINETLINNTPNPVDVLYLLDIAGYGCETPDIGLVVKVFPTPVTPTANSNTPVCLNNLIRLQTAVVPNATYQWTGPNGFTSNLQNPVIANATMANAGVYSLTVILNNCASAVSTTDVHVNVPPTANAGPDQTICVTTSDVILRGEIGGGTNTGVWSGGSGLFSSPNDLQRVIYHPSAQDKANGSVVLTLTSTSKDDCVPATDQVTITFAPTPSVEAGTNREVCIQDNVVPLAGQSIKPGPVNWTSNGTGSFSNRNSLTSDYLPSAEDKAKGSVTLTLHYTNANPVCDIESDEVTVKFIPPPTISAGGRRFVLKGNTIILRPTTSDPNVTYSWSPAIGLNDNTLKNPTVTGDVDRTYVLTVTDSRGCVSTDQAEIVVSPLITTNNTFTPNGDGVNDLWTITGLIAYTKATVDIFDRYGAQVYHSIGYDQAWDGTYNGRPVPAGVYYYVIRLNVDNKVLSGSVTVLR